MKEYPQYCARLIKTFILMDQRCEKKIEGSRGINIQLLSLLVSSIDCLSKGSSSIILYVNKKISHRHESHRWLVCEKVQYKHIMDFNRWLMRLPWFRVRIHNRYLYFITNTHNLWCTMNNVVYWTRKAFVMISSERVKEKKAVSPMISRLGLLISL